MTPLELAAERRATDRAIKIVRGYYAGSIVVAMMEQAMNDACRLAAYSVEFETIEQANAAGVFSGMLANGDTFGDEDDGPEGGHSEFESTP